MSGQERHLSEEALVLHHYGESDDPVWAERHLSSCEICRRELDALVRDLDDLGSLPVPERGPDYGDEVWRAMDTEAGGR